MYSPISRKVSAPSVFFIWCGCCCCCTYKLEAALHTTIAFDGGNGGAIHFFNISFFFLLLLFFTLSFSFFDVYVSFFIPFSRLIHAACYTALTKCSASSCSFCFLCTFLFTLFFLTISVYDSGSKKSARVLLYFVYSFCCIWLDVCVFGRFIVVFRAVFHFCCCCSFFCAFWFCWLNHRAI